MSDRKTLHERLDALSAKVEAARSNLALRDRLQDGHRLTSGEIDARYAYLKKQLDGEVTDLDAHETHVSALERSVLAWLNSIDLGR